MGRAAIKLINVCMYDNIYGRPLDIAPIGMTIKMLILTRLVYFAVQMEFLNQNLNGGALPVSVGRFV